ncbi:Sterile alpha motif domain-containing protein 3 [Frankliniella fusca]|uniref:Sterile alpha motif domain-containing protein 3 n=1 Tax=Frankliniella fusca TaxID=407009 RepID=A0AAE1HD65_9NEOP|nr:Sterile alpha motif domain-containing protein 3 [Frankliniella fusca]
MVMKPQVAPLQPVNGNVQNAQVDQAGGRELNELATEVGNNAGGVPEVPEAGWQGVVEPRVDLGPLPTVYQLPDFPDHLKSRIETYGRRIDASTKREILDILRVDMMRYTKYAYPTNYEYQRVAEKLVAVYPQLEDAVCQQGGGDVRGWFSWKCALVNSFNRFRRNSGHSNPAIEQCREKLGLGKRKKATGGARVDQLGEKARRLCDPTCLDIPVEEGIVPDEDTNADVCELLRKEWEKNSPDMNLIVLRLNLTAVHRRNLFKNNLEVEESLNIYPPLRDPFLIFNDMERFFSKNIQGLIKEYFTNERCDFAIRALRTSARAKQATQAYHSMPNCDALDVKRDYVLAALPALSPKEHLSKWVLVGQEPKGCGAVIRADSDMHRWLDPTVSKYTIILDGVRFSGQDGEFTMTEAICCCMSLIFLFDLKFPLYVTGAWRFLAEHVCGLPVSGKRATPSMQHYINLLQ